MHNGAAPEPAGDPRGNSGMQPPHLTPGVPRHQQITEWLRSQIEAGTLAPHEQLPSEHELSATFGVSRVTVRRALQTLEGDGLIYRRQGLGSFVAEPAVRQGLVRLTDFAQDMDRAGLTASSRILHYEREPAPTPIAEALLIDPGTPVMRLDRLRLGDDEPIAFDRTWLTMFYGQLLEGHDLEHSTIYRVLEQDYQIPVLGGRYRIEAANAPADVAEALEVPAGRALLVVNRISFSTGERRIYYQRRYYRSDRVCYELELRRDPGSPSGEGMPLREFEPVFRMNPEDEA